jgi:Flp pilus assembly pilin Flp
MKPFPRKQRGSAMVEYAIVGMLIVLVLVADPNVIKQLADALRDAYASFVYTLSVSWF